MFEHSLPPIAVGYVKARCDNFTEPPPTSLRVDPAFMLVTGSFFISAASSHDDERMYRTSRRCDVTPFVFSQQTANGSSHSGQVNTTLDDDDDDDDDVTAFTWSSAQHRAAVPAIPLHGGQVATSTYDDNQRSRLPAGFHFVNI